MNQKEIAELRRRLRPERQNITKICGCYVSASGEIISEFDRSFALMPEDEKEKYLAIFRRTLSGYLGKNLLDIVFQTAQVAGSDEHRLLSRLKDTKLQDQQALQTLYQAIISSYTSDTNFAILLAHDSYDVPGKKGPADLEALDSDHVFRYFLCAVCPVKMTKTALTYVPDEQAFLNRGTDFVIAPPEAGFLFPAFDGRATNLYQALYYTHSEKDNHPELVSSVFHADIPMPAAQQKQTFRTLLQDSLEQECKYPVVQAVQQALSDRIEAHKEARDAEMLAVSGQEIDDVLESCGISEARRAAFRVQFDESFGTDAALTPRNLIENGKMEVTTPDVVIHVNPERSDLISTKTIAGSRYILIRAEEQVEVNGVEIQFDDPASPAQ